MFILKGEELPLANVIFEIFTLAFPVLRITNALLLEPIVVKTVSKITVSALNWSLYEGSVLNSSFWQPDKKNAVKLNKKNKNVATFLIMIMVALNSGVKNLRGFSIDKRIF